MGFESIFPRMCFMNALEPCHKHVCLALQENEISEGSSVAVILCGHKEMCQAITKQMQDVGVATERILTNF